ncbi:MAG TPA: potassium channel family protein [Bacillus bacterium]|nr:potassium channel family protein [Bacillus sp. (in: firmicutes)]
MRSLLDQFRKMHIVIRLLMIIIGVFIAFGSGIHFIEPESFPTIFDGVWWVIVTTATIGYGDFVPKTVLGRTFAILIILIGVAFVTYYMATVATTIFKTLNALQEGSATYKGKEHMIVIGWNEKAKNTIQHLLLINPNIHTVLIDNSLSENPLANRNVYFVKGNSTKDETLKRANIEKAGTVLITADQNLNEHEADMHSILTLLAVKGLNPLIYCLVEILTHEQVNNAQRAGADELVETYLLSSSIMVNSIHSHGLSTPIQSLLNLTKERRIAMITATDELVNQTFAMAVAFLIKQGVLLIGIKKGEEFFIYPSPSIRIEQKDDLLVIVQ